MTFWFKQNCVTVVLCAAITLVLFSCGNGENSGNSLSSEEKVSILISRSLQQTRVLVSSEELNDIFFKRHHIPKYLRLEFVKTYGLLNKKIHKVLDQFQSRQSVVHFLLLKHLSAPLDSSKEYFSGNSIAEAENPLYMAYAMVMEEIPNVGKLGNPLYIKQLAKSFGVSEEEIYEGVWYFLQHEEDDIFRSVALMIRDNLEKEKSKEPEFYFQNILLPFLTYTSMSLLVHPTIEKKLIALFSEAFPDGKQKGIDNDLFYFTVGLRRYLLGDSFDVKFLNSLNRVLMKFGFRMFVIEKTCVGYKIMDYKIPIEKRGIGEVKLLNKMSISLSLNYMGLSMHKEKDVVLTMDNFIDFAEDIIYTIENRQPPFQSYSKLPVNEYWDDLQIGFPIETADSIHAAIVEREFKGQSKEDIVNRITLAVSIHEVKHKWDENIKKGKSWYNVDSETSAHLTEISYGGVTLYSLLAYLNRYQTFYCNIDVGEVREQLKPIIQKCWELARHASEGTIASPHIISEMKMIYATYELLEGNGNLPDMEQFNKEIVETCFNDLSVVTLKSIQ